ncbi:MAG TPA: hypothetical protein VEH84_07410 [Alphaproteobacteria bacterium]|nr:hypothetical protein [Alphaproteobacteria bacterium]
MARKNSGGFGGQLLHAGGAFALARTLLPKSMRGKWLVAAAAGWAAAKYGPQIAPRLQALLQQRHGGSADAGRGEAHLGTSNNIHLAHGTSDEPGARTHSAAEGHAAHPAGARSHGGPATPTVNQSLSPEVREREVEF